MLPCFLFCLSQIEPAQGNQQLTQQAKKVLKHIDILSSAVEAVING